MKVEVPGTWKDIVIAFLGLWLLYTVVSDHYALSQVVSVIAQAQQRAVAAQQQSPSLPPISPVPPGKK